MADFVKYPRTPHLQGSRLQPGDEDLSQVAPGSLTGGTLVWEEKLDGANTAFSFDANGRPLGQSRGHVLRGGAREAQFALFKAWIDTHQDAFRRVVGTRFIVFGEWCFAKHTVFYDRLPHYFLEFDIYDRARDCFLSTPARRNLLDGLPIASVPVVHEGPAKTPKAITALIKPSLYKSPGWRAALAAAAVESGQDPARIAAETENSDAAEGLYLKHEAGDRVVGRYKFVRADFHQAILDSGSHWHARPIIQNRLAPDVDVFTFGSAP